MDDKTRRLVAHVQRWLEDPEDKTAQRDTASEALDIAMAAHWELRHQLEDSRQRHSVTAKELTELRKVVADQKPNHSVLLAAARAALDAFGTPNDRGHMVQKKHRNADKPPAPTEDALDLLRLVLDIPLPPKPPVQAPSMPSEPPSAPPPPNTSPGPGGWGTAVVGPVLGMPGGSGGGGGGVTSATPAAYTPPGLAKPVQGARAWAEGEPGRWRFSGTTGPLGLSAEYIAPDGYSLAFDWGAHMDTAALSFKWGEYPKTHLSLLALKTLHQDIGYVIKRMEAKNSA